MCVIFAAHEHPLARTETFLTPNWLIEFSVYPVYRVIASRARTVKMAHPSMTGIVSLEKYLAFLLTNIVNLCYIQSDYSLTFASEQSKGAA